jgi:hypothetical protein
MFLEVFAITPDYTRFAHDGRASRQGGQQSKGRNDSPLSGCFPH